jgi:hypothetical protein
MNAIGSACILQRFLSVFSRQLAVLRPLKKAHCLAPICCYTDGLFNSFIYSALVILSTDQYFVCSFMCVCVEFCMSFVKRKINVDLKVIVIPCSYWAIFVSIMVVKSHTDYYWLSFRQQKYRYFTFGKILEYIY